MPELAPTVEAVVALPTDQSTLVSSVSEIVSACPANGFMEQDSITESVKDDDYCTIAKVLSYGSSHEIQGSTDDHQTPAEPDCVQLLVPLGLETTPTWSDKPRQSLDEHLRDEFDIDLAPPVAPSTVASSLTELSPAVITTGGNIYTVVHSFVVVPGGKTAFPVQFMEHPEELTAIKAPMTIAQSGKELSLHKTSKKHSDDGKQHSVNQHVQQSRSHQTRHYGRSKHHHVKQNRAAQHRSSFRNPVYYCTKTRNKNFHNHPVLQADEGDQAKLR